MFEFYKLLNKVPKELPDIEWKLLPKIRGKCKGLLFCPLTAVYYMLTDKYLPISKMYDECIRMEIGLSYEEVQKIVSGADNRKIRYYSHLTEALNID